MLTPQSGRQVRASGIKAPSRVFSSTLNRPFVIERQVCNLSTKSQVSTTLHYRITVCCNRRAHRQHCLPASEDARELNLKYARATGKLNSWPFAPVAECVTTRPQLPLNIKINIHHSLLLTWLKRKIILVRIQANSVICHYTTKIVSGWNRSDRHAAWNKTLWRLTNDPEIL